MVLIYFNHVLIDRYGRKRSHVKHDLKTDYVFLPKLWTHFLVNSIKKPTRRSFHTKSFICCK